MSAWILSVADLWSSMKPLQPAIYGTKYSKAPSGSMSSFWSGSFPYQEAVDRFGHNGCYHYSQHPTTKHSAKHSKLTHTGHKYYDLTNM